ncbi:hypothetical protein V5O48_007602 [Marasmius crinis-equi]|uniref:MYND-type domain-containing protein n=1 Tax=Marasmius crinis-equi TaxID=585013 RepID=A0ABR3FG81_9AGAR
MQSYGEQFKEAGVPDDVCDGRQYRVSKLNEVYAPRKINPRQIKQVITREPPPVSSIDISHPTSALQEVLIAITSFAGPIRVQSTMMLFDSLPLRTLWPSIAGWTVALMKAFVLEGTPTTPEGIQFRDTLLYGSSGIPRLLQYIDPMGACTQVPQLIPTLTDVALWLAEINHPAFELCWRQLRVVTPSHKQLKSQFQGCVDLLRTRYDIPRILLGIIADASRNSYPDVWLSEASLSLLHACTNCRSELNRHLRASNGVHWLAHIMSRIAVKRSVLRNGDVEDASSIAAFGCHFLLESLKDGLTWVIQMLDGHVILSMAKLVDIIREGHYINPTGDLEGNMVTLMDAFKPFLLYRSVLNRVARDIRITDATATLKIDGPGKRFWKAFEDLRAEAQRTKAILREFDADETRGPGTASCCVHRECSRNNPGQAVSADRPTTTKVQRCGGCRVATYCSRECQRADWKAGHREKCKSLGLGPTIGDSGRISHLDIAFIKFLTHRDLETRQSLLSNRASVVAQYDYRLWPMKFSVISVERLLQEMKSPRLIATRIELVKLSKEKHQIVHVLVPGADPHSRLLYTEET